MKVLLVGASGTVGAAVGSALASRGHDLVRASRTSADHAVDLTDPGSIDLLVRSVGPVDAIACAAGGAPFGEWADLSRADWMRGLENKLLGQVELVRRGTAYVRPGGSFTLITGVLAREPVPTSSVASAVNGALEAWVRASALELWGRWRINAVSPTVLAESAQRYDALFPGHRPVPAADVASAYVRSIESTESGQVYCP